MKKSKIIVHIDWEDNYGAVVDTVCCVAAGKTVEEVKSRIRESLPMHLEAMREHGEEIPVELQGNYELFFVLTAQALLKSTQNVITQVALSRATGINQQRLSNYATGLRRPRIAQRKRILTGIHQLGRELLEVE